MTSRTPAVIDALVTTMTAVLTTYDGRPVTSDTPSEFAIVGGTDDPDDESATAEYEWAGLGAKARNQRGDVTCCVVVQSGDTDDVKAKRDRAYVLLNSLETAITANPTLAAVTSGQCLVTSDTLIQRQSTSGAVARLVFTVTFTARI